MGLFEALFGDVDTLAEQAARPIDHFSVQLRSGARPKIKADDAQFFLGGFIAFSKNDEVVWAVNKDDVKTITPVRVVDD